MKQLISIAVLTGAILTLCTVIPPVAAQTQEAVEAPAEAKPVAVVNEAIKDLGAITVGDKVDHGFEIGNLGTAPLEIREVASSCGCTVADYDQVIAPGETGQVRVRVDTSKLNGPVTQAVTVLTNDPANPEIQLTLKLVVRPLLQVTPGYARFITVHGEKAQARVTQAVWASDHAQFNITKITTPSPQIRTEVRPATDGERRAEAGDGSQWQLDVFFDYNKAPVGPVSGLILLELDHPKQKEIRIPVSGFVRPTLAITPDHGRFGDISSVESWEWRFLIQSFLSQPVKVTKAEINIPGIDVVISPLEEGRRYQLLLTAKEGATLKGKINGILKIHTTAEAEPVIEVPLSGTVL